MKKNNIRYVMVLLAAIFIVQFATKTFAQDNAADDYRMMFYLYATKNSDDSRTFKVQFLARNKKNKKDKIAVVAAPIEFYNVLEDEVLLGEANTDKEGFAILNMPADHKYLFDEEGFMTIIARFPGSDVLDEEEEELMIMDLQMELELLMEDSVRMAYVTAYTLDSLGEKVPVEGMDLVISVESMISDYPIAEDYLEEGEYEIEVPGNIPGDPNGDLTIKAFVDESDEFGTVVSKQKINWGNYKEVNVEEKNMLWTEAAPTWMYIVLTIMLVGVWANFVYTIFNLKKIKKMGKN